jgi:hypothetical protein
MIQAPTVFRSVAVRFGLKAKRVPRDLKSDFCAQHVLLIGIMAIEVLKELQRTMTLVPIRQ